MKALGHLGPQGAAVLAALCLSASEVGAMPLISEILYDSTGSDNGLVFVELWGEPGCDLDGLVIEGVNGADGSITTSLTLTGTMPDDGFFVVADDMGDGTTLVPEADAVFNFDFQNGPDSVVLRQADIIVDAVGYGEFGPGEFFAGEGFPAPDAPAGSSLGRVLANIDTNDNLLDFEILDVPTPGTGVTSVPEPSQLLLIGSALCVLALMGRPHRRRA
jgi:hypothetical protein